MTWKEFRTIQTRRRFLDLCAGGIGTTALAQLLAAEGRLPEVNPLAPKPQHFPAKAKRLIYLFMEGAPSQVDLFDPKPELAKWDGKPLPESLTKDIKLAFIKPTAAIMASQREFKRHGQSGAELSDWLPHTAQVADDLCFIRSMHTEAFNHHPAQLFLMSGSMQMGRPTLGSWLLYGLGSESQNLPGFIVLGSKANATMAGSTNWTCGFLPSTYQGVHFRDADEPIVYLKNPQGLSRERQRAALNAMRDLNAENYQRTGDIEIASRVASYELAFRMQAAAPELLDFSGESEKTLEAYGIGKEPMHGFGSNCLMARRLVERGVRSVMIIHTSWDDHKHLNQNLKLNCDITDQPTAALMRDLKQRGLLEDTLVVWGGEFGRTPMGEIQRPEEADSAGRDHLPDAFTIWMAGAGVKTGQTVGKTDDLGLRVVEDPVHVHDLQATILHFMGLDHTKLTYRHMGRDFRLTDVAGEVVGKVLG
ncbi:MAG: DUF1501 domain-containing protein [Bryobacterales bacterium]|nr:DUF1501 domain-containing protein [Bryobacterales bacterium]